MFIHLNKIQPIELKVIENFKGRFYITPQGNKYPSITTLLSAKDKPWLKAWRESLGVDTAEKEMKRTADRGTAVHNMIERFLRNEEFPTENHERKHITEFNSVKVFLKKINNIHCLETALYSDMLRVAGRVDCIAEYQGNLAVIDFKTTTTDKTDAMIEDYYLQTTAYALMAQELYDINIENIVIIMSSEKGICPLIFKKRVDDYIEPLLKRINTYYKNAEKTNE